MATVEREQQTTVEQAAKLRARIARDASRVAEIDGLLEERDREIAAARGDAIRENPTAADLGARFKSSLKRLMTHRDSLEQERRTLDAELPHRQAILAELESSLRLDLLEEFRARRVGLDARVRADLGILGDVFSGLVATWGHQFVQGLEELDEFHAEVRRSGLDKVDAGLISCPVEMVPDSIEGVVEMLSVAAGIRDHVSGTFPWPLFTEAAGVDDLREFVREAQEGIANLGRDIPR